MNPRIFLFSFLVIATGFSVFTAFPVFAAPTGPATIVSFDPQQATQGQAVSILGTNLTDKVQLKSATGVNTDIVGVVDSNLAELQFELPLDIQPGQYTLTVVSALGNGTSAINLKVISGQPLQPNVRVAPPTQGLPTNLGQLIQQIFTWSLALLGIAVFVMIFYAGFLWLTAAGNTARVGEARSRITNAVFGAIILLSSYLILNTINPNFVKNTFNLPGLGKQNTGGGGEFVACDNPPDTLSPDPMPIMQQVKSDFPDFDLKDESPGGGRDKFTTEVAKRLNAVDSKWGRKKSSSGAPISTDTLGYLRPDVGPDRFEAVDLIVGSTGALQRGCVGAVGSSQVWVAP